MSLSPCITAYNCYDLSRCDREHCQVKLFERCKKVVEKQPEKEKPATKLCNKCGVVRPIAEFYYDISQGNWKSYCRICQIEIDRVRRLKYKQELVRE